MWLSQGAEGGQNFPIIIAKKPYTYEGMHARFIVLEGPDGSGTTSHTGLLAESLRKAGFDVLLTFQPSHGPIGKFIRSSLREGGLSASSLQLLFSADRAWHMDTVVKPALQEGKMVICDRYDLSTVIYGEASGVSPEWLRTVNDAFPRPDVLLLMLPPFSTCMERLNLRDKDILEQDDSLQKRVYESYRQASLTLPSECVVDTSGSMEETAAHILRIVKKELPVLAPSL